MKTVRITLVVAAAMLLNVTAFSQAKPSEQAIETKKNTPVKNIENIIGAWKATRVYNGNKEIGVDSTGMQWVEFSPEGKYTAKSKARASEAGSYRLNEGQSRLYLETKDSKNPIEWVVSFKDNTMTLTSNVGSDKAHAQQVRYVFVKTKEGLSTNK